MVKTTCSPVDLSKVKISDEFWKKEMELVRTEVIPYQWRALNDKVEGAEPSYAMRNFALAGKITAERRAKGDAYEEKIWPIDIQMLPDDPDHPEDRFYGYVFQDSDFSKWIEAVGYSLAQHPDQELEATADGAIDIVCAAQQENGYLGSCYIINNVHARFSNLKDHHELYCFGHLTEGAVAYYQATGKDKLLNAARKYADYICTVFGKGEGKIPGYPGHEIAEMALVRLFDVTGDQKYLNLATYFINERGTRPYYFDNEDPEGAVRGGNNIRYRYYQSHLPVREQTEAIGHAVRATYLFSGMADVARLNKDESLYNASRTLWENITTQKMYITGGIGGTHIGESFSFNYDLPNDTAYSETCAAIALMFFARRMLQMDIDSRYSNVMERALYNTVLAGMALDGKSFFYVNPLEVNPYACRRDERKYHVKPVRQKWFGCACCPPNIARLLGSVASYAYTESEDTLYMHLYVGGEIEKDYPGAKIVWNVETTVPRGGKLKITAQKVENTTGRKQSIAIRIPEWCDGYTLSCGDFEKREEKGYVYVTGSIAEGDTIDIDFSTSVRIICANNAVAEDYGKVAVSYGPMVYCLEEIDNGPNLHTLSLIPDACSALLDTVTIEGNEIVRITLPGKRELPSRVPLYSVYVPVKYEDTALRFIPYYAWANRCEGEMRVWINQI